MLASFRKVLGYSIKVIGLGYLANLMEILATPGTVSIVVSDSGKH